MYLGPMQIIPAYKKKLDSNFLKIYEKMFNKNDKNIYLHWSAGPYDCEFDDYHYNIHGSGKVVTTFTGDPFTVLRAHTYMRNHDAVGIGVLAMQNATTENYGRCPVTAEQIKSMLNLTINICCNNRIPVGNILTHEEAGSNVDYSNYNEPYSAYGVLHGDSERWDFYCYINPINLELKTAKANPDHGHVADPPSGWLYFPDWIRGETMLKVQEMTKKYWDPSLGKGL